MAHHTQKKALVLVANGSEEMEAVTVIDVLRRAGIHVLVLAAEPSATPVVCSRGVRLVPDAYLGDDAAKIGSYDAVVVPGGVEGAASLSQNAQVRSMLADFYAQRKLVAAICAGSLAIKTAGIQAKVSQPLRLTSHPSVKDQLDRDFHYEDARIVVDGNLVTSRGPGTALEFALRLVGLLVGDEKMREVAAPMVLGFDL
ncbi:hypothetical protein GGI04_000373 [Coemansia thaxteri]|nr:hypothetical protein GGI04_000373 [Coemansia thaxteri]KAJ2473983.1 hypothetical protein GGI02_000444 [Coemansia sp. RSA 2322]